MKRTGFDTMSPYLYPFYINDINNGTLDKEFAIELVACTLYKIGERRVLFNPNSWDGDVVNIGIATGVIVVHHVRGAKRAAGAVGAIIGNNSGQRHHVISRFARNVGNGDIVTAVAQVDAVLIFHILQHTVNDLVHARVKLDALNSAEGAGLQRDAPTVTFSYRYATNGEMIHHGKKDADAAPVALLTFLFLARVRAEGAIVAVGEGDLLGRFAFVGNPVGVLANVLRGKGAGIFQLFAAVARGSGVIGTL